MAIKIHLIFDHEEAGVHTEIEREFHDEVSWQVILTTLSDNALINLLNASGYHIPLEQVQRVYE